MKTHLKNRVLSAGLVIAASSMVAVGCGCDDIGCSPLEIEISRDLVPEGGSVEIRSGDGKVFDCENWREIGCSDDWTYFVLKSRPPVIFVRVLDQDSVEVTTFDIAPSYTDRRYQNACGDCDHAAFVSVPPAI